MAAATGYQATLSLASAQPAPLTAATGYQATLWRKLAVGLGFYAQAMCSRLAVNTGIDAESDCASIAMVADDHSALDEDCDM